MFKNSSYKRNANHSNYPDVVTLDLEKKKKRMRRRRLGATKSPDFTDSTASVMENN